ncbi:MAG TPA: serine hydrolase domain-containing protein [Candidatus Saccharimonadales bacterium]|nr:serine hydrolase domain-containing protein [Candidatus Saccharimonadales bacterium]
MNKQALDHSVDFIKSWLQFRYDREEVPGYVVAIAHKGKILMNEAYGYADLEQKTKLTPQHIFRIASHSKTFTATALMQLQEQGKLRIDDYVVGYLPWLKKHADKRWQKVTVRQLMSHGAGVIRDGLNADYWQLEKPFPGTEELQKEILEADLVIDTNTKLKYSNFGYSLLGMVIEAVSGKAYNDYVKEHIVNTLGLRDTGPEYTPEIDGKLVTGYTRRDVNKTRLPITQIDTKAMASATGFYSTSQDLVAYFSAHFTNSDKLLDDESKKEMQRVQWHAKTPGQDNHEDYGLGLEIEHLKRRKTFGHGGGFPGHITKSIADPKDELVVIVLTNCLGGPADVIAKSIYDIIDYYQQNTPDTKPKHDMSRLEGRFMNLWAITNIVVTGDKVVATYPDAWQPITDPEVLEYVDEKTLKVSDTGSFESEEELVHFHFKDGTVESINYNGFTMWPEDAWLNKQQNRKLVG